MDTFPQACYVFLHIKNYEDIDLEVCNVHCGMPAYPGSQWEGIVATIGWDLELDLHYSLITPWKINIEPTNHPFRKENDLPGLHDYVPC